MSNGFKPVPLYGGALKADLPAAFMDVSDIRPVPDTQEVWVDSNGLTGIIFDILERITPERAHEIRNELAAEGASVSSNTRDATANGSNTSTEDHEALRVHLADTMEAQTTSCKVWSTKEVQFAKYPSNPAISSMSTVQPLPDAPGSQSRTQLTVILFTLLRLVEQKTDLVVTISIPVPANEDTSVDPVAGRWGAQVEGGMKFMERILTSFEVVEWGLFDG